MSNFNRFDEGLHREYSYYSMSKWLYHPDHVNKIKERRYYDVMPVTAQIAPTLACNFSCPRCSYGGSKLNIMALRQKSHINMDRPTLFSIIDKLQKGGVKGLVFTGGGEPILNPFTIEGMHYASKKGLKVGLFTNGSVLTKDKIISILNSDPSFLRVSLDSGSVEVHSLIHGYDREKGYFHKILNNLELMAKKKVRRGINTTIGVGVSVEPLNLNDLTNVANELYRINDNLPQGGIDYLVFRPVVNYHCGGFRYHVKLVLDYLEKHLPEYSQSFLDYVYKGIQYPKELFIQANEIIDNQVTGILCDSNIQVINIRRKMLGISEKQRPFTKCRACAWYIFIGPDGTVYNCVELGLEPRVAIGNLLESSLEEIWASLPRKEVLDYINREGLHSLCPPVCLYYEMNILLEQLDKEELSTALKWIKQQELRIRNEKIERKISQPHIEFI